MITRRLRRTVLAWCLVLACGCASHEPRGVPIESRPTPPQPGEAAARDTVVELQAPPAPAPDERETQLARVVADTTAARDLLGKCAGRKLLPDQEGVHDATGKALRDARAALLTGDLVRAQSLARQARSLASSLGCR
jgi:hypothetical protein